MLPATGMYLLILLLACESGLSVDLSIEVADETATAFAPASPGLLRAQADGATFDIAPACGDLFGEALEVYVDLGFGCLDEREGTDTELLAWIEPVPAEWDLEAFCALEPVTSGSLPLADIGAIDTLATSPDESWPQGASSAPWKRDLSPCGGRSEGGVAVE